MRGFVQGLVWGSLAAVGGLVVLSQVAGTVAPVADGADDYLAAVPTAPEAEAESVVAPEASVSDAPVAEADAGPAPSVAPDGPADGTPDGTAPVAVTEAPVAQGTVEAGTAPQLPAPAEPATAQAPAAAPAAPEADRAARVAPAEPPAAPPSDAPGEALASAGQVSQPMPPATGDAPQAAGQPAAPALPEAEGAPAPADLPPLPPLTPEEEALLLPLPEAPADVAPPEAAPVDPTPEPGPLPEPQPLPAPDAVAQGEGALLPAPGLGDQAEGVVTGRLPRIGGDAPSDPDAGAEAAPEVIDTADLPPRLRYARPFDNAAQKPLFAILLQDNGQEGVNRAELAALELPLSIVIDPLSEGAAERAAIWRAGGQEVVMAGTGIPVGAGPGDLEQSFQVLSTRLPEAVAVIDPDGRAFQNDRPLATQVVPILAEQGRGLVTFDQGLNAADQVARREGLAAAVVFRSIDSDGEASPVVRRYLDRAAFKAAQEGRVIVIGDLRPETVAGVLEWAVEGRASTVALAPVSAMLQD